MAIRSLGTLTIDLIAKVGGFTEGMTKAERETEKFRREMAKKQAAIKAEWNKMSLALIAGITGLGAIVASTVRQAGELSRLSHVANSTTDEFQRMAVGAKLMGIEQDKLSDQLKDFTEKVGEFQQTGGGGMKDFFENIAPKIGLTAEAFRGLSGPQALQLYYNALEKAGLNQQQMSFYLESMASDTTALIPLLANGGKMLREVGDAAASAGAIMDEKAIKSAQVLQMHLQLLKQQGEGVVNQIVTAMLPAMSDVADSFSIVSAEGSLAADVGETFAGAFRVVASVALGAYGAVRLLGKGLGGLAAMADVSLLDDMSLAERLTPLGAYKGIKNLLKLKETAAVGEIVFDDLDDEAQKLWQTMQGVWGVDQDGKQSESWAERLVKERQAVEQALRGSRGFDGSPGNGGSKGKTQSDKDAEAAQRYIETLKRQADQVQQMGHYEKLLYDLREGTLRITDAATLKEAERLAIQADYTKSGADKEAEHNRLREEGIRLTEQVRTPLEQLAAEQERINRLYEAGVITTQTQIRALEQAKAVAFGIGGNVGKWVTGEVQPLSGGRFDDQQARYEAEALAEEERYAAQLERLTAAMEAEKYTQESYYAQFQSMAQTHADRMAQIDQARYSVMLGQASSGFGQLAETMKGAQGEATGVYKALFAVSKAFSIAEAMLGLNTAIANAMKLPWPANLAAAASAAGYMATIISNVQSVTLGFADGGYTGPGGKYDVAGLVHAGEGVLSQRDMAALGGPAAFESFRKSLHGYAAGGVVGLPPAVARGNGSQHEAAAPVVNVIEDASKAGRVESNRGSNGEDVINIFVSNIRSGGKAAQTLESTYGMARRGI